MNEAQEVQLTAYALGEVTHDEKRQIEAWLERDASARALLAEIRGTAALLKEDLAREPVAALSSTQRDRITAGPPKKSNRKVALFAVGAFTFATTLFIAWPREARTPAVPETLTKVVQEPTGQADPDAPTARVELAAIPAEPAPEASPRAPVDAQATLTNRIKDYFEAQHATRTYVQVDKPLYRPGDTVWVKSWDLAVRDLAGDHSSDSIVYQLIDPRGAVVSEKRVAALKGRATNDLALSEQAPGGEYIVRAMDRGTIKGERKVIVASFQAPRTKKKLELLRKAYGPGDEVVGTLELARPTGEPVKGQQVTAVIRLDGLELPRVSATTNDDGGAIVRFVLPAQIDVGDALVTVLVADGGVTESVSKRVPILMKKLQLSFFPEGGDLVAGLPSRVYFAVKDPLGKAADMRGHIVDDHGVMVAEIGSLKNGLGRFTLLPATGRSYFAEVTEPVGISERYQLPMVREAGCVLRSFDDVDGQVADLRVAVRCSESQPVTVSAVMRDHLLDTATVTAGPGADAVVFLSSKDSFARAQGAARVTVFDSKENPLAERLVYRNRRARLGIKVTPDRERYTPRGEVSLGIETVDATGEPVPAEVALAVVDDTVVSYADDKRGHMLSQLFLEPELVGEVEEPNYYLDLTEKDSGPALDMLMGTQGYRRFEWRPVLSPVVAVSVAMGTPMTTTKAEEVERPKPDEPMPRPDAKPEAMLADAKRNKGEPEPAVVEPPAIDAAVPMGEPVVPVEAVAADPQRPADDVALNARLEAKAGLAQAQNERDLGGGRGDRAAMLDDEIGVLGRVGRVEGGLAQPVAELPLAPVRVFPIPAYQADFNGTRSDFRDTIAWAPSVTTDAKGRGMTKLTLSDAVTSFRVFAEGIAGETAGRSETVFASSLPFSMVVRVPTAVTSRDVLRLPLTLTNEGDAALKVTLHADLGSLVSDEPPEREVALAPHASATVFFAAKPGPKGGATKLAFRADAQGLHDAFEQALQVEAAGFPETLAQSGQLAVSPSAAVAELAAAARHELNLGEALAGSVEASVKLYPSPVSKMLGGLEAMLQEPSGCFEQTSSTNYPNVMVMNYLQTHKVDDAALLARSRHLVDVGYTRLTSYETKSKGYEWFGQAPAHEALTAYGLVEFNDMKAVYGGVSDAMIQRTATWLLSRRDGHGGYSLSSEALDSFGRASPEVTAAYITYSLTEVGQRDLPVELAAQVKAAQSSNDAYVLALASNTLLNVQDAAATAAVGRLLGMQDDSGAWTRADHSITRSGGSNLAIETTAFAVLALIKEGQHMDAVDRAILWLDTQRSGWGGYGTTQATVLSLKALTRYAEARAATQSAGTVTVLVDGVEAGTLAYEAGTRGPLELAGLGDKLSGGKHTVELRHAGAAIPYTLAVTYRTLRPAAQEAAVGLATSIDKDDVKLGETVRVTATVSNTTTAGQPMALARIGIPGGLTFQTWQLQELRDKGLVAFYETTPREVILYFRDLAPSAKLAIPLDLVAVVPGRYQASASSSYLYYTNDLKAWADGITVAVHE